MVQGAGFSSRLWRGFDAQERALALALAATTFLSVLAVGAVHSRTLVAITLLAVGGLLVASRVGAGRERGRVGAPVWLMLALTAWCLVQALPLPMWLLEQIAPANADVWSRALAPFGAEVTVGHISLDPGASLREALKGILYIAVFVMASRLAAHRGSATGVTIVFVSAVLLAVVSVAHWLLGATSVFGVYAPEMTVSEGRISPLLNPNNMGGYLNLGLLCGVGLVFSQRPPIPVGIIGVGCAVVVATMVRLGSRGAFMVLPAALLLFAVGLYLVRRRRADSRGFLIPAAVLGGSLVFGVAMAIVASDHMTWAALADESVAKLRVIGWTQGLIADYPWLGIGRGSFESVFAAYQPVGGKHVVFTHAENLPAQWMAEWGVLVGGAALVGFAYFFRPLHLNVGRISAATGAWVAAAALLVQNFADLSLELPGVAVAMVVILGTLWGSRREPRRGKDAQRTSRWLLPSLVAVAIGLSCAVLFWGRDNVAETRTRLQADLSSLDFGDEPARGRFRASLREAMLAHPADSYLPLLGGVLAWRAGDEPAIPWIQRALERSLMNGRAHLLLAEVLASRGAKHQALLELRWALQAEPPLVRSVAIAAAPMVATFEDAVAAAPEGAVGAKFLVALADQLLQAKRVQLADRCEQEALRRDESLDAIRWRLAMRRLDHLSDGLVCPTVEACKAEVREHAGHLAAANPDSSLGKQLEARLLLAGGDGEAAEALLDRACELPGARADCLELQITTLMSTRPNDAKLDELLKAIERERCRSATACGATFRWIGGLRASRSQWAQAAKAYHEAARHDPTSHTLSLLADAAERAGQLRRAIDALERLQEQDRSSERAARIDGLRSKAARQAGPRVDEIEN